MDQAGDILRIGEARAAELFPGADAEIRRRFRELAQRWHPDINRHPEAGAVFAHINKLHDIVTGKGSPAAAGCGDSQRTRTWKKPNGGKVVVRAQAIHASSLGEVIVTSKSVAYETIAGYEDVAEAEATAVTSFRFADAAMKKAMAPSLPRLERRIEAVGKSVSVFHRPADTVLLTDLVRHMGGRLPPVHAAWLVSCLENLACYLAWAGIAHGAISAENILVSPEQHSIVLVGGWGFATPFGKRPKALPERTLSLVPRLAAAGEVVDATLDLGLIRALAREVLGAAGSGGLVAMVDVPAALRLWLSLPPERDAFDDYKSWERCRTESFGPRKFVRMEVQLAEVYAPASQRST